MNLRVWPAASSHSSLRAGRWWWAFAFLLFAGSAHATLLLVESPRGDPQRYTSEFGQGVVASFTTDVGIQVQSVRAWMNGEGFASIVIRGPLDHPIVPPDFSDAGNLWGAGFELHPASGVSATWQGVSSLSWDLQPGMYTVIIEGGFVPYSYGGPPSTVDNHPFDFQTEDFQGKWHPSGGPFGLQIFGAPLSAVPEPATYSVAGSAALLAVVLFRRRRRSALGATQP